MGLKTMGALPLTPVGSVTQSSQEVRSMIKRWSDEVRNLFMKSPPSETVVVSLACSYPCYLLFMDLRVTRYGPAAPRKWVSGEPPRFM